MFQDEIFRNLYPYLHAFKTLDSNAPISGALPIKGIPTSVPALTNELLGANLKRSVGAILLSASLAILQEKYQD